MKVFIFIIVVIVLMVFAYFFPKGVRIFGIDAETFFQKNKNKEEDI